MAVISPTYQLTDAQYDQIQDLLPKNGLRGRRWKDHRLMIDGILWALSDSGRWRNLPERFGPWQSVYDRFRNWTRKGLWDKILRHLQVRKMHDGTIDWELFPLMARSFERTSQQQVRRGKNTTRRRAPRPRPGAEPRRLQYQGASHLRRGRHSDGGHGQSGPRA
jgi:transposase